MVALSNPADMVTSAESLCTQPYLQEAVVVLTESFGYHISAITETLVPKSFFLFMVLAALSSQEAGLQMRILQTRTSASRTVRKRSPSDGGPPSARSEFRSLETQECS